jgi:hypothetical protein
MKIVRRPAPPLWPYSRPVSLGDYAVPNRTAYCRAASVRMDIAGLARRLVAVDHMAGAEAGVGQPIRRMASSIRFQKPSKSSVVATSAFGSIPKRLSKSTEVMPLVVVPCVSTVT